MSIITTGDLYWDTMLKNWTTIKLRCVKCGIMFREIDNIGRWECWQHPTIEIPAPGQKWPCCQKKCKIGLTADNRGCVKSDHSILLAPFDQAWNSPIPKIIFKQFGLPPGTPSIIAQDENSVTVARYDDSQTEIKSVIMLGT